MENVIVVTINYRLHVLGFLSLPRKGISGNMGLKDQQMALEWIHDNISAFNGDPEKICLLGTSGGALSAHFQVMNPKSRRFISSAICQSGTINNDWAFYAQPEETVVKLAKCVGCDSESIATVYETLMSASAKDLYDNSFKIITKEEKEAGYVNTFRIVIEEESDDAFVTKSAIETIISQEGQLNIPMIFGTVNGDGMSEVARFVSRQLLKSVDENFVSMLPRSLQINSARDAVELTQMMKKFYFKGRELSSDNIKEFVTLRTDVSYFNSLRITSEFLARYQPGCRQFLYEFQFEGELNLFKKQLKQINFPLATHCDDIYYVFGGELADKVQIKENSREWRMRQTMCKMWTNFAKYHDPTPSHDNPFSFRWRPIQPVNGKDVDLDFLVINDEMKMVRNLNEDRINFWRKVYKRFTDNTSEASMKPVSSKL